MLELIGLIVVGKWLAKGLIRTIPPIQTNTIQRQPTYRKETMSVAEWSKRMNVKIDVNATTGSLFVQDQKMISSETPSPI